MDDNTKDTLCQMAEASYECHKGLARLARGAEAKPSQDIVDGLNDAEVALDAMRENVVALRARLQGN